MSDAFIFMYLLCSLWMLCEPSTNICELWGKSSAHVEIFWQMIRFSHRADGLWGLHDTRPTIQEY